MAAFFVSRLASVLRRFLRSLQKMDETGDQERPPSIGLRDPRSRRRSSSPKPFPCPSPRPRRRRLAHHPLSRRPWRRRAVLGALRQVGCPRVGARGTPAARAGRAAGQGAGGLRRARRGTSQLYRAPARDCGRARHHRPSRGVRGAHAAPIAAPAVCRQSQSVWPRSAGRAKRRVSAQSRQPLSSIKRAAPLGGTKLKRGVRALGGGTERRRAGGRRGAVAHGDDVDRLSVQGKLPVNMFARGAEMDGADVLGTHLGDLNVALRISCRFSASWNPATRTISATTLQARLLYGGRARPGAVRARESDGDGQGVATLDPARGSRYMKLPCRAPACGYGRRASWRN
ncbi:hypothetical protein B0H17DRAFT_1190016 [Mycena rosella]|uniref:Uncharacterized protein n=1 Tax=Mycena rosella TaxID=1033263 RepID=A0AAD7AWN7_MYCRO|nr:hypothetical protein B0H17DRAFT_1190016 [Mycena rosella]